MEVHPTGLGAVLATSNFLGVQKLLWFDYLDDAFRTFDGLEPGNRLALDRFGFAWVLRGGRVERILLDVDDGGSDWEVDASFAPEVTPDVFMYSDYYDLLFTLSPLGGHPYLAAFHAQIGLLTGWTLDDADLARPFVVAPSRGGQEFWIGSGRQNSSTIYRYGFDPDTGIPEVREVVVLDGLPGVQSIQETDAGRLLIVSDDRSHEFTFDDGVQQWVETDGSRFGALENVAYLRLSCNRSSAERFANPEDDPDSWHILPEEDHVPCPADVNHDRQIDFADVLIVLSTWGPCEYECSGDADDDHDVDFGDLLAVLASWGPCPE